MKIYTWTDIEGYHGSCISVIAKSKEEAMVKAKEYAKNAILVDGFLEEYEIIEGTVVAYVNGDC